MGTLSGRCALVVGGAGGIGGGIAGLCAAAGDRVHQQFGRSRHRQSATAQNHAKLIHAVQEILSPSFEGLWRGHSQPIVGEPRQQTEAWLVRLVLAVVPAPGWGIRRWSLGHDDRLIPLNLTTWPLPFGDWWRALFRAQPIVWLQRPRPHQLFGGLR